MSQTPAGALKAKATILEKYGEDYFAVVGRQGGKASGTGGFYYAKLNYTPDDPRHPSHSGKKGGHISRRGKRVTA
jgi:general stress protein YciG